MNKGIETLTGGKMGANNDEERSIHGRVNLSFHDEVWVINYCIIL